MCDLNKNSNFNQINHKNKSFNNFITSGTLMFKGHLARKDVYSQSEIIRFIPYETPLENRTFATGVTKNHLKVYFFF